MGKIAQQLRRHKEVVSIIAFLIIYCAVTMLLHIPCPILWITGVSCPGCGITRATLALCRLDIGQALYYNPSIFVVIAAVALLVLCRRSPKAKKWIIGIAASMMLGIYIYRMAVLHAPVLQFEPAQGVFPRLWRWIRSMM